MNDPLVRRTVNQLSRQTDVTTGVTKHRSQTSFDATTAMPRRESPEETASRRPAWDSRLTPRSARRRRRSCAPIKTPSRTRRRCVATRRPRARVRDEDRGQGGGVWGDRHEPSRAERSIGVRHRTIEPRGVVVFFISRIAGLLRPGVALLPYPDAYPSPRGFGPKDDRYDERHDGSERYESSKFGNSKSGSNGGWGKNETNSVTNSPNTLSPGADFTSSPTRSPNGTGRTERRSNPYAAARVGGSVTSVTSAKVGTQSRSVPHGVASLAGGSAGAAKENQDAHFHLDNSLGYEASRDGYEASDSSDGAHNFVAGVLDGHGVAGAKVSSLACAKISSEMKAKSKSSGFFANKNLVNDHAWRRRGPRQPNLRRHGGIQPHGRVRGGAKSLLRAHGADCAESGSTCVVCVREGDNLIVANVGTRGASWVVVQTSRVRIPAGADGSFPRSRASEAEPARERGSSVITLAAGIDGPPRQKRGKDEGALVRRGRPQRRPQARPAGRGVSNRPRRRRRRTRAGFARLRGARAGVAPDPSRRRFSRVSSLWRFAITLGGRRRDPGD